MISTSVLSILLAEMNEENHVFFILTTFISFKKIHNVYFHVS